MLELIRLEKSQTSGVFGVLKIFGECFCTTLEPPDLDNMQGVSCIPAGQYMCEFRVSPRFGETFEIMSVPDRTNVLFHAGNTIEHTHGCVLLGQSFGKLRYERAILNSGQTFRNFKDRLAGLSRVSLTIREV